MNSKLTKAIGARWVKKTGDHHLYVADDGKIIGYAQRFHKSDSWCIGAGESALSCSPALGQYIDLPSAKAAVERHFSKDESGFFARYLRLLRCSNMVL